MTAPVAQLLVRIAADTGALTRGGKQSERALDGIGRRADRATKKLAGLSVAAAAAAGTALFAMAKHAISVADELAKTARSVGVTAEALQELRFAAGRSGIEMKAFDGALMAFSKRVGEARAGTGSLVTILNKMSPALLEQVKAAGSVEEAFDLIVDAASRMGTKMDRNALLAAAFGRTAGVQMANLVQGGVRAVDDLRAKARSLGIVISDDLAARAEQAADELGDMNEVLAAGKLVIGLEFMPVMQALAKLFTDGNLPAGVRSVSKELAAAIQWMSENTETVSRFAGAWSGIVVGSRFGALGAAIGGAVGAFAPELLGLESLEAAAEKLQGRLTTLAELGQRNSTAYQITAEKLAAVRKEMEAMVSLDAFGGAGNSEQPGADFAPGAGLPSNEPFLEGLTERADMWTAHLDAMAQATALANDSATQTEIQHQAKLGEIAKRAAEDRARQERQEMFGRLNATANFFGDLASLAEAAGDDAFKQQKMLAIASALIGSIESATHAFNWGTKIGGPVLGAAFAAAATAAQVARVAQIKSVQPGGGGTASSGGGFSAPATPAQAVNSQQTLLVQGIDAGSLWRGDNVRDLAERLIEFQENGGRVVIQ